MLLHHLQNILIAYRSAEHANAAGTQRCFQAHVGHGRRHHQIARQLSLGLHVTGRDQHHAVPIHHPAVGIGKQRAVRIAVEGDPQVRPQRLRLPGHDFGVQRAAVFIDIAPVRGHVREMNLPTKGRKKLGRNDRRRPIGAINHNLFAIQVQPRDNTPQKGLVLLTEFLADRRGVQDFEIRGGCLLDMAENLPLDLQLGRVRQLVAIAAKYLDPVVLPGIMRSGNDDPSSELMLARQESHAGSGDNPSVQYLRSPALQSGGNHGRNPGTGFSGI